MRFCLLALTIAVVGCTDRCNIDNLSPAEGELGVNELAEHCGNPDCGDTSCNGEGVTLVGFPQFINTHDPDQPQLQPNRVILLTSSDDDSLDCSRDEVSVLIEPENQEAETVEAVDAMFRAIHATATSEGQNYGTRKLRVRGTVEGHDRPMNTTCERGLTLVVTDPADVVID